MNPVAVIFDFDGVVADSFEMHRTAWIDAFHELFTVPFPELDPEQLTGQSSGKIAEVICEAAGIDEGITQFYKRKTELVVNGTLRPEPLPGVREIFRELNRRQIPVAVASNAPREYLYSTLKYFGVEVPVVLGFEQVENPKPAPDIFLTAAEKCGVSSTEFADILVFEDSVPGITAASAAGMNPVGIRARFSDEQMVEAGALFLFDSLKDALENGILE